MNRGILVKCWRETWPTTLLFGTALLVIEAILAFALPKFQNQISVQLANLPFLREIIGAMIGAEVGTNGVAPEMFAAIAWVHPVVLAIVWAHTIVLCTRMPAGEVDTGTIDVLLALPVSRWQIYLTESFVVFVASVALMVVALSGNALGATLGGDVLGVTTVRFLPVATNLLALMMTVAAVSWLSSSLSDRRGRASAAAFLVVLASFLLNYLAQFWGPAKSIGWMSLLKYHQPLRAIQGPHWPWSDLCLLIGAAGAMWVAAGLVFARRDLATT